MPRQFKSCQIQTPRKLAMRCPYTAEMVEVNTVLEEMSSLPRSFGKYIYIILHCSDTISARIKSIQENMVLPNKMK